MVVRRLRCPGSTHRRLLPGEILLSTLLQLPGTLRLSKSGALEQDGL